VSERTLDRLARVVVRRDLEIHRSHLGPSAARWHFSFADHQDPTHIGIGALRVFNHSDASVLVTHLEPGRSVHHVISPARGGYAHLIAGAADLNEHRLEAGDAALITEEGMVEVEAHRPTELMLVDTQL
jgi:hypothetical protein